MLTLLDFDLVFQSTLFLIKRLSSLGAHRETSCSFVRYLIISLRPFTVKYLFTYEYVNIMNNNSPPSLARLRRSSCCSRACLSSSSISCRRTNSSRSYRRSSLLSLISSNHSFISLELSAPAPATFSFYSYKTQKSCFLFRK